MSRNQSNNNEGTTIVSEVIAASLGGAISASILYPLEVLKTKMQASDNSTDDDNDDNTDQKSTGMISYASNLYQTEGYSVFVRGMETSAFQSAIEKALYFFAYTGLKDTYHHLSASKEMSTMTNLLLGCLAEWAHLPITLPIDAWTTRIQTSTTTNQQTTPLKILLTMLSDKNTNFYKGISAYYILCFKPALQYTIYEQIKKIMIANRNRDRHHGNHQQSSLSSVEAFLLGMVARTISTVLVFPFIRAKVLLQAQQKQETKDEMDINESDTSSAATTTKDIIIQQFNQHGIAGLYQGIGPELTRGVFSAALMLMIKERIAEIVKKY